jgi:general secretion pathway protein C
MNRLMPRLATNLISPLVSLALFGVLCATLAYWAVTLSTPSHAKPDAALAGRTPPSVDDAAHLFGGQPDTRAQDIHLLGVLSLDHHVAAILSIGNDPVRAVGLDQQIGTAGTLAEVRAHSIVIDQHGVRSEVFIPAAGPGPTIYMR